MVVIVVYYKAVVVGASRLFFTAGWSYLFLDFYVISSFCVFLKEFVMEVLDISQQVNTNMIRV